MEQVPCRWSSDSEGVTAVRIELKSAETVEQRVDGGWRNEDAVVQQLERPIRQIIRIQFLRKILSKNLISLNWGKTIKRNNIDDTTIEEYKTVCLMRDSKWTRVRAGPILACIITQSVYY